MAGHISGGCYIAALVTMIEASNFLNLQLPFPSNGLNSGAAPATVVGMLEKVPIS